jgi:enoyl-CoA hydratase/carnithine racemase
MTSDDLRVERDGRIGRILFQRPERLNSLTLDVQQAVIDAAVAFADGDEVRVVIIGGDGGTFTAGADVAELAALFAGGEGGPDATDLGRRMLDAVETIPAVTIARIEGHCVGAGVALAAACDLRIAAEDAYLAIPEVDLGMPLGWGAVPRLVREVGPARALELIGTCRPFTALEGAAMGFLNRVVPRRELAGVVEDLAATLAAKPDYALKAVTGAVRAAAEALSPAAGMTRDAELILGAASNEESVAAATAYLARHRRA